MAESGQNIPKFFGLLFLRGLPRKAKWFSVENQ